MRIPTALRFSALLGLAFAAAARPAVAQNALLNPGFESGLGSWTTWGNVFSENGAAIGVPAHSGSQVLKAFGDGGDTSGAFQFVPAAPGATFELSGWFYADSGDSIAGTQNFMELKIEFKDSGGTLLLDERVTVIDGNSPQDQWILAGPLELTAPSGTVSVGAVAAFVSPAGESGAGFGDDLLLEQTGGGTGGDRIIYDIADTGHTFMGFGTQIWAYDTDPTVLQQVLEDLNIRYVRIENHAEAASPQELFNTRQLTNALGIEWVYHFWIANCCGGNLSIGEAGAFASEWVSDLQLVSAILGGERPEFIELMNEPDSCGQWSTGIGPAEYNAAVKEVRAQLDSNGMSEIGIVGPGLSSLNWTGGGSCQNSGIVNNVEWIGALDADAVAAHAAWSSHSWDDGSICAGGAACVTASWPGFLGPVLGQDPNRDRPIFITEYASKEAVFHGIAYPQPDSSGGCTAELSADGCAFCSDIGINNACFDPFPYNVTNSLAFAVRIFENTLAHLNSGANVPFIWQAMDEHTEACCKDKAWGLVDLDGNPKPVFEALSTLCPRIPVGAAVLQAGSQDINLYSGAFLDGATLIVAVVNDSTTERSTTLEIRGVPCLEILEATAYEMFDPGNPAFEIPDIGQIVPRALNVNPDLTVDVTLPADSTLTLVLKIDGAPDECGACMSTADCADLDDNGVRDDACLWWACETGNCQGTPINYADLGGANGSCAPDGTADGNDRFHALNCFSNQSTTAIPGELYPCEDASPAAFNVDAAGLGTPCVPDGVCDGNDAFAALNAFDGTTTCSCAGPAPDSGPAPARDIQPARRRGLRRLVK